MCLSTAVKSTDPNSVIMEYVSKISVNGDKVILTDVLGDQKEIIGQLTLADLTGGIVKIDCSGDAQ